MYSRRRFLAEVSILGAASQISCALIPQVSKNSPWTEIANQYLKHPDGLINFNTGSAGIMPISVLADHQRFLTELNRYAPYETLDSWKEELDEVTKNLAALVGADAAEIALVRNTTEAINLVLHGLQFDSGDEILYSSMDYPYVNNTLLQLQSSKGIELNLIDKDFAKLADEQIIDIYTSQITSATKLVILTYMTHREGQILPVKAITQVAKAAGAEVLVDGAHAAGHWQHSVHDIGCDYYATSLHKWLSAAHGTGLLYVSKDKIPQLVPPISYDTSVGDTMKKFDYLGTRAYQNIRTAGSALSFLQTITLDRKQQRLIQLADYLKEGLKDITAISTITDERSCGIVSFSIAGQRLRPIKQALLSDHKIHLKQTGYPGRGMLRTSLNLHLLESDIDVLLYGLAEILG